MKISIITVSYNSAATIADTLRSVAVQSYHDIEYLIIDGCSTDTTLALVNKYGSRVSNLISEPDRGIYDAMNKGIALATGDVVGFLNSDDLYPHFNVLQVVADAFRDSSVDVVWSDLCYVDQEDTNKIIRYWRSSDYFTNTFIKGWVPPHPTFFMRRELFSRFGVFDLRFRIAADMDLMYRLLETHKVKGRYIDQVMVHMRMGGTTNKNLKNIINQNIEILKVLKFPIISFGALRFFFHKAKSKLSQFIFRPINE